MCPSLVLMHNHRDGDTPFENPLQAQPHETLTAKNSDRECGHRDAVVGDEASLTETDNGVGHGIWLGTDARGGAFTESEVVVAG
jgi:hypothetical protein